MITTSMATELNRLLSKAMPIAGSRQLEDGPTQEELAHEAAFEQALVSMLLVMYRQPFFNGLLTSQGDLRQWIVDYYAANQDVLDQLRDVITPNMVGAFNIGGQIALDELGLGTSFDLQDDSVLRRIGESVDDLVNLDGGFSLAQTTASETAAHVERQRESGLDNAAIIAAFAAYALGRTMSRSTLIAQTESVRMSRAGLVITFVENGVTAITHETQGDDRVCPICQPLQGKVFEVESVASIPTDEQIPLHGGCRCYYSIAVRTEIEEIWTGG